LGWRSAAIPRTEDARIYHRQVEVKRLGSVEG
jgi:hypothetical protein